MNIHGLTPEELAKGTAAMEKAAGWIFALAALLFCICVGAIGGFFGGPKIAMLAGVAALALATMLYAMQIDTQKNFENLS